jgi:pyridoxine 5-phosphate synthase
MIRLGVNIDHVATVRNARGGDHPCPVKAALLAEKAGADGITAHLREDRRHIRDVDIARLKTHLTVPLNLEMATTQEMQEIALNTVPHAVCLVPERRQEVTTEGGLNVKDNRAYLTDYIRLFKDKNIRVSLFIDASLEQVRAAKECGADIVEFHTGPYSHAKTHDEIVRLANEIATHAALAHQLGLECHAGHGLRFDNVAMIAAIPFMKELNIGHFLIGEAMTIGLAAAITEMKQVIQKAIT